MKDFLTEYRWLSNFWEVEIKYDNIIYPSVEHYYVAMKIDESQKVTIKVNNKDVEMLLTVQEIRQYISKIELPGRAKTFGKKIKQRKDWNDIKVSIMNYGLKQKYSQEPFKTKLIETYTQTIVETNYWKDTFWGVCDGVGKNVLGKMIMSIRERIRAQKEDNL